jgi:hypothetical protein
MWSDYPCKIWTGATRKGGYGVCRVNGRLISVHRAALQQKLRRPLISDALHYCDTPACYEPEHLYEGTHAKNMHDMYQRSRDGKPHLSVEQRLEIKAKYVPYVYTIQKLATEYGVTKCAIWKIINNKNKILLFLGQVAQSV